MSLSPIPVLPEERQRAILRLVERDGRVLALELARAFSTSEDTIRRDLRELAAAGLVQRVYGGAVRRQPDVPPYAQRETELLPRKDLLGRAAAGLIRAGEVAIIDAGSTNLAIARALPSGLAATIVTNSPHIAACLAGGPGIELVILGGSLDAATGGTVGATALRAILQVRADLYLAGACSVAPDHGVAAGHAEEAALKAAMVEVSGRTVAAVLNHKLGAAAAFRFAAIGQLDQLVVEHDAPESVLAGFAARGRASPEILHAEALP